MLCSYLKRLSLVSVVSQASRALTTALQCSDEVAGGGQNYSGLTGYQVDTWTKWVLTTQIT